MPTRTIEELEALIAALVKELEEAKATANAEANAEPEEPEIPKAPLSRQNQWALWELTGNMDDKGTELPPHLNIEGVEFDENGWSAPDEEGGRIFKPAIVQRDRLLNSDNRRYRYAARFWKEYHCKWMVRLPDAPEWDARVHDSYYAAKHLFGIFNFRAGFEPRPVYTEFYQTRWKIKPIVETLLSGYFVPWAGNRGIDNARKAMESYCHTAKINHMAIVRSGAVLDYLDKVYATLEPEEIPTFMEGHPGYEAPDA